ncbi:hypothetical protein FN846DRAFT_904588 [Sphaerosporella brunnea]|uniref:Uncharacterized protein n=1 Tax=Sphaerosporella brunnea TaxID=1250544 RepID=A0A5J5F3S2_9PEZI|nr:hypothetical protein FN846DRAFT_904588 [Sphaerosporella brunnea]
MLFNSSFSFAPKPPLHEGASERATMQQREVIGAVESGHDLQLSPHSTTNWYAESPGSLQPPAFFPGHKHLGDHPSWPVPSASTAVSPGRKSPIPTSHRFPNPTDNPELTMKFFNDKRNSGREFGDPVIESALTMDIAALKVQEKPRTISVLPNGKSGRNQSTIPDFPQAPKRVQHRPPMLKLEQSPSTDSAQIGRSKAIDRNLLSPFQTRPSSQTSHSSAWCTQTAESIGIQMLINTFDEGSDDEPEECTPPAVAAQAQPSPSSFPRPLRLETAMPSIEERGEASSETSSIIDSLGPATPISFRFDHRRHSAHSLASTIPTSISEGSMGGSFRTSKSLKRRSVTSSKRYSFNSDDVSAIPELEEPSMPKPRDLSEAGSLSSGRRSSSITFFCRGTRDSVTSHGRHSIGLGSIAASDIDLEAGLENSTHFPGVEELKKQISWLALRGPQIYDSDEEEEEEEIGPSEDYHHHLTSMVPPQLRRGSKSSMASRRSSIFAASTTKRTPQAQPKVQPVPTGTPMQNNPPRRRNRRRTASSECVVLETLEKMRIADGKASIKQLQGSSKPVKPTPIQQLSPKQLLASNIIDEDFWDSSNLSDTAAWDRMLGFQI